MKSQPTQKILILCPYPQNQVPGQRLKYEQYFEYFRNAGYQLTIEPFISAELYQILYQKNNYLKKIAGVLHGYLNRIKLWFKLNQYDGVYVFLYITPFGSSFFERLFRWRAKKIIYDIDDLVFLGKTSAANRAIANLRFESKYFYLMKSADHVITCTPYLDQVVRKYNQQTTDISSTINTETYRPRTLYQKQPPLTIGWSGSHSTTPYLKLLEPVFSELKKTIAFNILVIGDSGFKFNQLNCQAIAWNEASEVADLSQIDVGVYPLPNEPWVYGKSGLKALQYMALGIPTVATAIGTNFRIIQNNVNGFLVNSQQEWFEVLKNLLTDAELRQRIGQAARQQVEKNYSIKANAPTYLAIFEKIYREPRSRSEFS